MSAVRHRSPRQPERWWARPWAGASSRRLSSASRGSERDGEPRHLERGDVLAHERPRDGKPERVQPPGTVRRTMYASITGVAPSVLTSTHIDGGLERQILEDEVEEHARDLVGGGDSPRGAARLAVNAHADVHRPLGQVKRGHPRGGDVHGPTPTPAVRVRAFACVAAACDLVE